MKKALPYRNLYIGIVEILKAVFEEEKYADKEIEKTFKANKLWGSRDRSFVAELTYDTIRWKRLIDYASGGVLKYKNYWDFIAAWFIINDIEIPHLDEFRKLNTDKIKSNYRQASKIPAVWHSVSDELYQLGKKELGEQQWHKELEEMNSQAKAVLRCNTLQTTPSKLKKQLAQEEITITAIENYPLASEIQDKAYLFGTEAFQSGKFEMQDANSQLVAPYLDTEPNMRVVDACAGAGGKTLHLAALMQNKGQIIAMDIYESKLKELKRRAKRNKAHNIQTKPITSSKTIKRIYNSFDRVLIDAPCTGVGVLKRNPDAKYKINAKTLDRVAQQQQQILAKYPKMLKKNGIMVYATCSIFPTENQKQVHTFLEQNPDYQLIEDKTLLSSETGFDGFYMAKIRRNQ